jgi:hypothetical protein
MVAPIGGFKTAALMGAGETRPFLRHHPRMRAIHFVFPSQ